MLGLSELRNAPRRARFVAICLAVIAIGSAASPVRAGDAQDLEWKPNWRPIGAWETLALIPMGVEMVLVETQVDPPREPNWRGGILGDELVRNWLSAETPSFRSTAAKLSDMLFLIGSAAPIVIDVGVVALAIHQKPDIALQMFLIDLQSLFVAGVISLNLEYTVGRARPYVDDCGADGTVRDASGRVLVRCSPGSDTKSFYSGHAAATATVAGLTCLQHQHMPLYGGGIVDLLPCLVTIAVSATTGFGRIIADMHWTSDVIIGWTIGSLSGYVLPALIHFGFSSRPDSAIQNLRAAPLPLLFSGGIGLGLAGDF